MQSRNENDLIPIFQLIRALTLKLPIRIIDHNQYPRPPEGMKQFRLIRPDTMK